jgi:hypothetical protein
MNLEEYKSWLKKNGNKEEAMAYEVAKRIIDWHLEYNDVVEHEIELYPHFWYEGAEERLEYDLLIKLRWRNRRQYERLIGIEFKELDFRKVVTQAIARRDYVDYMWIATQMVVPDPAAFLELIDLGIGWVIWEDDGFIKILVPARFGRGHLVDLIEYLARREVEKAVKKIVEEIRVSSSIRTLFDFVG